MSTKPDGGPAFPQPNHLIDTDRGRQEAMLWMSQTGMSLLDYYFGQALAGIMANPRTSFGDYADEIVERAFEVANTAVKARAK